MILDIIIYGEFDYIVRAFKFTAMMFSPASGYIGLIGAIGMAAIMFGGLSVIAGQVTGGKGSILGWFIQVIFASVIIIASVSMKCEIIVHDKTLNKVEAIGEVPALMGYVAYLQNTISNTTKDMITTIMAPIVDYDMIGKGQGYQLLSSLDDVGKDFFNRNPQTLESLGNYMQYCVAPDMTYGWIDPKAYNNPIDSDMWTALKSDTMTRFSPVVSINAAGNRTSIALPCAQAYTEINAQLSMIEMDKSLKNKCAKNVGEGTNEQTACQNTITTLFNDMVAPGVAKNAVIRNYLVSWAYMSKHGMLYSMLNEMNKKNISGAFMAEQVLPKLKGMMFGLIIGIFPFLVAFLWIMPGKTTAFYGGLFLLMILWNAIDTFMDMQYQNEVFNMYAIMRKNGLGLYQMFDIPNLAADAVSLYGQGRWMTLALASGITAAVTGISTHALSSVGAQLTSSAQGAALSGSQYADSAGQSRLAEKANIDAGARAALSQTTVANWGGTAHMETQRLLSNMAAGNAFNSALGNSGTANYKADNAVDSLTSTHGGFSGDKSMAQATGFSNIEQYRDWANQGKIIDANVAKSLEAHGVPQAVAQSAVGLSMASAGVGSDGNITNFAAKGVDANGQDRSVSMSENVSRFQVQGGSQNINGFEFANGTTMTLKYNADGSIAQINAEGGGATRFAYNTDTGYASGKLSFEKNGIEYTQEYNGNSRNTTFTDKSGDTISRHEQRNTSGAFEAYQTDTTVGRNGYNMSGIGLQEGSRVSQGVGGISSADGVFNIGSREFAGTIKTNADGNIISMQGRNGQSLTKEDIDNYNMERKNTIDSSSRITGGFHTDSTTILDQAYNGKTGNGTIMTEITQAYQDGLKSGDMSYYNSMRNEVSSKLADALWYKNTEGESWSVKTQQGTQAVGKVGASAEGGVDTSKSFWGKTAEILTGASANGKLYAGGELQGQVGISNHTDDVTNTVTESMKIDISKSIDTVMQSGGDDKALAGIMQQQVHSFQSIDNRGITSDKAVTKDDIDKFYEEAKDNK